MFTRIYQNGTTKPQEKTVCNTGLVILCEDIHIVNDISVNGEIVGHTYGWYESRLNASQYADKIATENYLLKKENTQLWDSIEYLLKLSGQIPTEAPSQ